MKSLCKTCYSSNTECKLDKYGQAVCFVCDLNI